MHEEVFRALEFGKVTDILAAYAVSERARLKARSLRPMVETSDVTRALEATSEMVEAMREGYTLPLPAIEDVSAAAERARAGGGPLEPSVLWRIAECMETAARVGDSLRRLGGHYPALTGLGMSLPRCPELVARIRAVVDAAGAVLDGASPRLAEVRRRIRSLRSRIEERLRRIVENPDVRPHLQYPNPTIRRDRYVLPVNAYRRREVPGLVHGSSDSGATLYIEPMEIIEQGNELSEAIGEEEEEVRRVLWELTRSVGASCEDILRAVDGLAEADLLRARALMSIAFRMCRPRLGGPKELELRQARHPLLLWLSRSGQAPNPAEQDLNFQSIVPLDVTLGRDFNMLLITGPNTGGKTVALKTVGLLCLMARAGLHVPAEHATIPLYDAIYADIGDEQSLEQSLSTFSSHMQRVVRILRTATSGSLVLLDELGAGTDPAEGAALGEAILRRLSSVGCSAVVVTHLGRLKTFASTRPDVENASMEFDTHTLRPTYRLTIGTVGSSNALEIAERLGLPPGVLRDARRLLDADSDGRYSSVLEQVRLSRRDAEQRRERLKYLERETLKLKLQYEETLARLRAEEARRGASVGLQMRQRLEQLHGEADRLYEYLRHSHRSLSRRAREVREGLAECLEDLQRLLKGHRIERPLKPGDEVYVIKIHRWGTVERVASRGERVRVRVGDAQIEVPVSEVQPWADGL